MEITSSINSAYTYSQPQPQPQNSEAPLQKESTTAESVPQQVSQGTVDPTTMSNKAVESGQNRLLDIYA